MDVMFVDCWNGSDMNSEREFYCIKRILFRIIITVLLHDVKRLLGYDRLKINTLDANTSNWK